MSRELQIVQAKPNPFGKDKTSSGQSKPEQLLGEWVDIKNVGTESIRFSSMNLYHTLFDSRCQSTGRMDSYWSGGNEELLPNQVIRIHTGKFSDKHLMSEADRQGVDWHGYANRDNFVLNNRCGDKIKITWTNAYGNAMSDTSFYRPNPPEGAVLRRRGDELVPISAAGRF